MDKSEAHKILGEQLARFGSYTELVSLVASRHVETLEIRGTSGVAYQVGIRAFVPLTQTLLVSPPESVKT